MQDKTRFGFSDRSMLVLCAAWLACLAFALVTPASWDVAWRIEIGQRILKGATLYKDIVEVNPPLWFWSVLPSNFLANVLGFSPYAALCLTSYLIGSVGLWLLNKCAKPLMSDSARFWLILTSLIGLFLVPVNETGQRELPLLLAGLLWACLGVRRAQAIPPSPWLTIAIACFCAYGFALKHYYLIVPIGLEVWLILILKRNWRPFRTETLSLAIIGLAYGISAVKLAPHFLTDMVPLIVNSYEQVVGSTADNPYAQMFGLALKCSVLLIPFYFARRTIATDMFAQILFVLCILQVAIIILQAKGFANHFLAAKGTVIVFWGYVCGVASPVLAKQLINPRTILAILTLGWVGVPTLAVVMESRNLSEMRRQPSNNVSLILQTITQQPKSSRIFVVATSPGPAFFMQWMEGRPHYSRYYSMWMVPGLLKSQSNPARRAIATNLLQTYQKETIADIRCAAPNIIVVDTMRQSPEGIISQKADHSPAFSILIKNGDFRTWLETHYTQSNEAFDVTIWRNKSINTPKPVNCPAFQSHGG